MKIFLNFKRLLFIILIGITFTSCTYKDVELVGVEDIKLGSMKNGTISLNTLVKIKNPNSYKIKIESYNLDIIVNNQTFQLIEENANINIPKNYLGTINIPVSLKSKGLLNFRTIGTVSKIFSSKKIDVDAKGIIGAKFFIFTKKIKVDKKTTLNI